MSMSLEYVDWWNPKTGKWEKKKIQIKRMPQTDEIQFPKIFKPKYKKKLE